jgi:ABC-type glycerol-3-phosphate transport system permease component
VTSLFKPGASILDDPLGFDPAQATLRNWTGMVANVPIVHALLNTMIVVVVKGGVLLIFSPPAGYGFAKFAFPFKDFLFGFVLLTLMLPTLVLIVPLLLEMSQLGWINSYKALILPGAVDAFGVFWMRLARRPRTRRHPSSDDDGRGARGIVDRPGARRGRRLVR